MIKKSSKELFERSKKVMPGGVNSPVRAFKSVGASPLFIESAKGNKIYDVEGREYIDLVSSWGPMILGHGDERVLKAISNQLDKGLSFGACTLLELELAELITEHVEHVEMIRMVNSGTEAVMSALRLARGYTRRDKVIKFEGCYHGHSDAMLVKAGSGAMTFGTPNSSGVTKGAASDTLIAEYNDIESVKMLFEENKGQIACVIVEPVAANMGLVLPKSGFLNKLRDICDKEDALLIFDEVITGFRLGFGGAAIRYGVTPDIVTYGKIIGGGMPVGAYGGKADIMKCVSPSGTVYQAGTLSGNPVAMTAGISTLKALLDDESIYKKLDDLGDRLAKRLNDVHGITVANVGSLVCAFHKDGKVENYNDVAECDTVSFANTFEKLLKNGVYTAPSQFESMFLNDAFTIEEIDKISDIFVAITSE